jgi:transcriptional activator SPT7
MEVVCWSELTFAHIVISTPMDFQTMLKRVKARTYKSKREFKDDLDLIWSNCLTYNAAPVRHSHYACCVYRLSFHAEPARITL